MIICSFMGLPWYVAATVISIAHIDSLKMETETSAPGEQPKFLGVRYVKPETPCLPAQISLYCKGSCSEQGTRSGSGGRALGFAVNLQMEDLSSWRLMWRSPCANTLPREGRKLLCSMRACANVREQRGKGKETSCQSLGHFSICFGHARWGHSKTRKAWEGELWCPWGTAES